LIPVVTGASTGIGHDLPIAADESWIELAAVEWRGSRAMPNGEGDAVAGWDNKPRAAIAHIAPARVVAERLPRNTNPPVLY
jgi:hypothetical protein